MHVGWATGMRSHYLFHSAQLVTEIMLTQELPVCLLNTLSSPNLKPEYFPEPPWLVLRQGRQSLATQPTQPEAQTVAVAPL